MDLSGFVEVFTISLIFHSVNAKTDKFSEEMFVKPLPDGKVYTHFQFTTQIEQTESSCEIIHIIVHP